MILRNVTYSEQHRVLPTAEVAALRSAAPVAMAVHEPALERAQAVVPAETPLTIDRVLTWLKNQDVEIRSEVAIEISSEIDELHTRAVSEGQALGAKIAVQEVQAEFDAALRALKELVREADAMFMQQREELANACVAIVDESLAKLLGPALREPGASLAVVRQAIAHIAGAREVTIRVNAAELDIIAAKRAEIAESLGSDDFKVVADRRVSSGGCLVESSFGEMDGRWESQLSALLRTLHGNDDTSDKLQ